MISGSFHCARTVAVLSDSKSGSGALIGPPTLAASVANAAAALPPKGSNSRLGTARRRSCVDSMQGKQRAHPRRSEFRITQQSRGAGQTKELGQMYDAARALLAADHREVRLMAVEPREENDTRLIKARRRCKNVA